MNPQGLLAQEMRRTYAAQRGVSQGAHITLSAVSGGFQARFECAQRCEQVLGNRGWQDDEKTLFLIPMLDLHSAITSLSEKFSVALVDTVTDEQGSRFVLVWKIEPAVRREIAPRVQAAEVENPIVVTPPDGPAFVVQIQNTGPDELDAY